MPISDADKWNELKEGLKQAASALEYAQVWCNEGDPKHVANGILEAHQVLMSALARFRGGNNG